MLLYSQIFFVLKLQLARLPINPKVDQVWVFCASVSLTPESVNPFYIASRHWKKEKDSHQTVATKLKAHNSVACHYVQLWLASKRSCDPSHWQVKLPQILTSIQVGLAGLSLVLLEWLILLPKEGNKISCRKIRQSLSSSLTGTEIKKLKCKWNEPQDLTEIALFQKY